MARRKKDDLLTIDPPDMVEQCLSCSRRQCTNCLSPETRRAKEYKQRRKVHLEKMLEAEGGVAG